MFRFVKVFNFSIKSRLFIGTCIAIVISMVFLAWTIQTMLTSYIEIIHEKHLVTLSDNLAASLDKNHYNEIILNHYDNDEYNIIASGFYWQIIINEELAYKSKSLWDTNLEVYPTTKKQIYRHVKGPFDKGIEILISSYHIEEPDIGEVQIYASHSQDQNLLAFEEALQLITIVSVVFIGLILFLIFFFQISWVLGPFYSFNRAFNEVKYGESSCIKGKFSSEFTNIVETFNNVSRLHDRLFARLNSMKSNFSHSIKTPLTIIKNEISKLKSKGSDVSILEEQLNQIFLRVENELHSSEVIKREAVFGRTSNIAIRLHQILQALDRLHYEKTINVINKLPELLNIDVEEKDLDEILGNILDNAYKWAKNKIVISHSYNYPELKIIIEDDGPGINRAKRKEVIERGTRLDTTIPGHGIGLSIVKDLIDSYSGLMVLKKSKSLGGLRVEVTLASKKPYIELEKKYLQIAKASVIKDRTKKKKKDKK